MDIYIKRDDGQFGPFSPEQIEECLASGALIETDIAWHAALPDWVPVTEVLGTLESASAQEPAEPVPAKVAKSGGSKKLLIAGVAAVVVLGGAVIPAACCWSLLRLPSAALLCVAALEEPDEEVAGAAYCW